MRVAEGSVDILAQGQGSVGVAALSASTKATKPASSKVPDVACRGGGTVRALRCDGLVVARVYVCDVGQGVVALKRARLRTDLRGRDDIACVGAGRKRIVEGRRHGQTVDDLDETGEIRISIGQGAIGIQKLAAFGKRRHGAVEITRRDVTLTDEIEEEKLLGARLEEAGDAGRAGDAGAEAVLIAVGLGRGRSGKREGLGVQSGEAALVEECSMGLGGIEASEATASTAASSASRAPATHHSAHHST